MMKLPRSTNMAEGWHHEFNSMLSCTHPSIWKFLEALKMKKEQNLTRILLGRMRQLDDPAVRPAKWAWYENRLQRLSDSYDRHTSVIDFLLRFANMSVSLNFDMFVQC
jgi:hypothetical protein